MPANSQILTAAESRFGVGLNGSFIYNGVPGHNNGTTLESDQYGNVGPGIDCSGLVYQSLLAAGYNVGSQRLTTGNFVAGSMFDSVAPADVQAGDIITFQGHVGIVKFYDPSTGKGIFYGSQTSTGPDEAQFSINGGTYWGGAKAITGFLRPNDSLYDPQGAAAILQPITDSQGIILKEVDAPSVSFSLPIDMSDPSGASNVITSALYAQGQSADINGDIGLPGITPSEATALGNQWQNAFAGEIGTISSYKNIDNGIAIVTSTGNLYQLKYDGSWTRTTQNSDGSVSEVQGMSNGTLVITTASVPDASGNCLTGSYTINGTTGSAVTNADSTISIPLASGTLTINPSTSIATLASANGTVFTAPPGQAVTLGNGSAGGTTFSTGSGDSAVSGIVATDGSGQLSQNGTVTTFGAGTQLSTEPVLEIRTAG